MNKKERIHVEMDSDRNGDNIFVVSSVRGAGLTLADIHNEFVKLYGGGIYAVIINANSGEYKEKISSVDVYDACCLFGDEENEDV